MATWLITGSNRGIGLELTRQAAAQGHAVIAAVRDPTFADALKALATQHGVRTIALDVAEAESIVRAKRELGDRPIDLLINNAGITGPKHQSVFDMDFDGFARTLTVNTLGPLRVTQAFLPNLRAAHRAKVVAISSLMGSFSFSGTHQTAYCVSKTALNRLMHALAEELRHEGIAVGVISPGWVRTDMGGASAPLSVEESARGLIREFADLTLENSGAFRSYDGKPLPW